MPSVLEVPRKQSRRQLGYRCLIWKVMQEAGVRRGKQVVRKAVKGDLLRWLAEEATGSSPQD